MLKINGRVIPPGGSVGSSPEIAKQGHGVEEAARLLGGIGPWTLRKHIAAGSVKVTRIGRRVLLLPAEELERIRREGLPSLANGRTGPVEAAT